MQRFLEECCTISLLNGETLAQCQPFNCGDADLDNFFLCDAVKYERQLLGRSYCFRLKENPACRYLTVDAYNNEEARKYYEANGFQFLFSTEEQEREHIGLPDEKELKTNVF
jgi:hypothetical protein